MKQTTKKSKEDITVVHPSAEDVYADHYNVLNEEVRKSLNREGNLFNMGDTETIRKEDEQYLKDIREEYDEKKRPILEKNLSVATEEDEEEMNEIARRCFGVEI